MKLGDYLAKRQISVADFAKTVGVADPTIRRYIAGQRIPKRQVMARISLHTSGEVTAVDFYQVEMPI